MKLDKLALAASLAAMPLFAHAAGVGIRAGTTGVGGDFAWNLAPTLNARLGYSALNYSTHVNTSNVSYDAKYKLSNFNAFLDWNILGPLFRITGGVIPNDNRANLTSTGTYTLNGNTYQSSDTSVSGTVKPGNKVAPYLGIGWGNVAGAGINFYADLGVMYMGSPKATLSATCGPSLNAAQCAVLQNDVAAEQARVQDKVNKYKYYPVANIGVTIGF